MAERRHITLKTKLAAALCLVFGLSHDEAKALTEDQVLLLAQWDHFPIPHALDGPDAHWNLVPLLRRTHQEKTKADVAHIAKVKRVDARWRDFMSAIQAGQKPQRRQSRWPKRRLRA